MKKFLKFSLASLILVTLCVASMGLFLQALPIFKLVTPGPIEAKALPHIRIVYLMKNNNVAVLWEKGLDVTSLNGDVKYSYNFPAGPIFEHRMMPTNAQFTSAQSQNGRYIAFHGASASKGSMILLDCETFEVKRLFEYSESEIFNLTINDLGNLCATKGTRWCFMAASNVSRPHPINVDFIDRAVFSQDGQFVLSTSGAEVTLSRAGIEEQPGSYYWAKKWTKKMSSRTISDIQWFPGSSKVLVAESDGTVRILNAEDGLEIRSCRVSGTGSRLLVSKSGNMSWRIIAKVRNFGMLRLLVLSIPVH